MPSAPKLLIGVGGAVRTVATCIIEERVRVRGGLLHNLHETFVEP
jgi:hypothetical protein